MWLINFSLLNYTVKLWVVNWINLRKNDFQTNLMHFIFYSLGSKRWEELQQTYTDIINNNETLYIQFW